MAEAPIDWYRVPVDRETLKRFTRKSDARGWLQAGSFLLIYLCTGGLALFFFLQKWWGAMIAACYVHAMFQQMIGMSAAVHELSHGTPFKTRALNEIFYHLFCFLTWNNPVHFRASHVYHHQFTVYRGRDKEVVKEPVRSLMNWRHYLSWLTFDYEWFWTLVKTTVLHAFGNEEADFFAWDPLFPPGDPRRAAMCRWARIMLFGSVILVTAFSLLHLWVLIFLVTLGGFFVTILGRLTGAIQHQGLAENTPDWRLVAHTVEVGPVLRYLYWNMNYHIDHHMYAAVPFYQLPKFHEVLKKDLPLAPASFSAGLRLVLSIKRDQQKTPGYTYVPRFPDGAAAPRG
ncbi:MAG TPA: fatty acid desaturase [Spirochaetia bacterium]|nr:fatty acid desaturase [Spirochaetia bacterium]